MPTAAPGAPDRSDALRWRLVNAPEIPTLPSQLARIFELTSSETSSRRELVEVLERDQALTGRVLRLANSSFVGQPGRIGTLGRAVMILGFETVESLALGAEVWGALLRGAEAELRALWRHSALVAMAARDLAHELGGLRAQAFTAGLLHDVGRAALHRLEPRFPPGEGLASELDLERERGEFGADHAQAGRWLADAWKLPEALTRVVSCHHEPGEGAGDIVSVVRSADRVVSAAEADAAGEGGAEPEALPAALAEAGLGEGEWPLLWARLQDESRGLVAAFGTKPL